MNRLLIHVEGETEETFVNEVLSPHLYAQGYVTEIEIAMGSFRQARFIPYVMMHEFEGLLFSDCRRFGAGIGREDLIPELQSIRDQFGTPEEINDSPITAPSKRILNLVPGYQKPLLGSLAALEIGLEAIRGQCPFFNRWLARLESLPELNQS